MLVTLPGSSTRPPSGGPQHVLIGAGAPLVALGVGGPLLLRPDTPVSAAFSSTLAQNLRRARTAFVATSTNGYAGSTSFNPAR